MTLLFESQTPDGTISASALSELEIYSKFEIENTILDCHILQKAYVPKKELDFYKEWKEKIISELIKGKNAVTIRNIARRHRIKLPKQI